MKKAALYYFTISFFVMFSQVITGQDPAVTNVTLESTSSNYSTNDDIWVDYTAGPTVVETATTWYGAGRALSLMQFPFEAGATNALLDYSGRANNATLPEEATQEPTWTAGAGHNGSGAFVFDGDDYLIVGDVFPLNSSYTKSAWIYLTEATGYKNIISGTINEDRNHGFKVNPTGRLNAGHSFGNFYVIDPDSLHNDTWYFVSVTFEYETGLMILYRDGVEVDRDIVPEANRSVIDPGVLIGSKVESFFMNGRIDDPRLYGRALSLEQIQSLQNDGGEKIISLETKGNERWRAWVTPFSNSVVGVERLTQSEVLQAPGISGLSVAASSTSNLTTDDLLASYTANASVIESATAWYRDGSPDAILYLPFNGSPSEAMNDYSGSANHSSNLVDMVDDPTYAPTGGHNGSGAYVFDRHDYLEAGDILPLNSSYTKTIWLYSTENGYNHMISSISHGANNHSFKVNIDGRISAGHNEGDIIVADPNPISLNTWYFAAVTFDYATGDISLYKDGVLVAQANVPEALRSISDPSVLIGCMEHYFSWNGMLDEARIYDRVLTPQQISAMYSNGDVVVEEETVGGEIWHAEVTPFASNEAGSTIVSNSILVHSVVCSDIPDQSISEGSTFSSFDLDDYVTVYEFTEGDLVWSSNGNSELGVSINAVSHVATISVPDDNWYGSEDITFTATNPNGDSDGTEASFTVQNVNDAPELTDIGDQSTDEDNDLTGLEVEFTDLDPTDSHTITVSSDESNVTVENLSANVSGSTYDLAPAANWNGLAQITVSVRDNGTGTLADTETYTLTVDAVNDAPEITTVGDQDVDEDNTLSSLSVDFTDVDAGDTHSILVVSDELNVVVGSPSGNISGSTYELVPAADWNGTALISVTVTDNGTGTLTDLDTYTLTVNPTNDAPVLTEIGDQSVNEDNTLSGLAVVFSDLETSDSHTITVVSNEVNVTVENLNGHISGSTYDLVPVADWIGTALITVTVTDNGTVALSDSETYTLEVHETNDAPVLGLIGDQSTNEDNPLTGLAVTFTDLEVADSHTITIASNETNVSVANLSGHVSGSTFDLVPAADWNGTAQITVSVTDDGPGTLSDSETFTLTVNPVNDAPVLTLIGDQSTDEDNILSGLAAVFTDVDIADTHTISISISDPTLVTVRNHSGNVSGSTFDLEPLTDWNGTVQITVTVTDNGVGTLFASETFTLTVSAINDAPVSLDLSNVSFDERVASGTVVGMFSSSDLDIGDTHQYTLVSGEMDNDNDAFIIVGDTLKTNAEFDFEAQSIYWIRVQSEDAGGETISGPFVLSLNDIDETAVDQVTNPLAFSVYPVPAYDLVTVEIDNPDNNELILEIYTNNGTLVHSENTFTGNTIDLNSFADGMYFVTIRGESVYGTRKIIVKDR